MPSKCKQGTGYEYISFGWQGKTLVEHELNLKECVGCRQVKKKKVGGVDEEKSGMMNVLGRINKLF